MLPQNILVDHCTSAFSHNFIRTVLYLRSVNKSHIKRPAAYKRPAVYMLSNNGSEHGRALGPSREMCLLMLLREDMPGIVWHCALCGSLIFLFLFSPYVNSHISINEQLLQMWKLGLGTSKIRLSKIASNFKVFLSFWDL